MKIALIGATGYVGSAILDEALSRGHHVTGLVRNTEKLSKHENLRGKEIDILDEIQLAHFIANHDAVICSYNAFNPRLTESVAAETQIIGMKSIITAVKKARVKRLLVVGGAGSLEVAPQTELVDTPQFPNEYKSMALAMREVLNIFINENNLEWTFLSPSALLIPGERTGKFRLGKNQLLVNENGESKISIQDYAVAMIDELEIPKHNKQRFTVGY